MTLRATAFVATLLLASSAAAADFSYKPAGTLVSGSGTGRVDSKIYAPGMRFPIEKAPAYANSQVWGHGGNSGPGGGQCDVENFSYPWWDNYCETRSWTMPLCPAGKGHQGQDIRGATCTKNVHNTSATADGKISQHRHLLGLPHGQRRHRLPLPAHGQPRGRDRREREAGPADGQGVQRVRRHTDHRAPALRSGAEHLRARQGLRSALHVPGRGLPRAGRTRGGEARTPS